MFFITNKDIILLFLCLLGCSNRIDEDLVKKLFSLGSFKTYIDKSGLYSIHHYIELYIKTEKGIIGNNDNYSSIGNKHNKKYFMEMYDKKFINRLIKKFNKEKTKNHAIYFMFADKEIELEKFIKYFLRKLKYNNVNNVTVKDRYNMKNTSLYSYAFGYLEQYKNNIVLKREKYDGYGIYIEETIISKECLTDLMKDHFDLYVQNISNKRLQELFKKYFYNHKLLLLNVDYFKSEKTLLERFPSEFLTYSEREKINKCEIDEDFEHSSSIEIPDTKYLNVLFHLLQDSDLVKDMIKYQFFLSKNFIIFRRKLEYLKINIDKSVKFWFKEIRKYKIVSKKEINAKFIDFVFKEMKKINIEDHIRNYKKSSKLFYLYLKKINFKDLNDLIGIIKLILNDKDNNYNDNNFIIFKRLIDHLRVIYKEPSKPFCYDLFHEKIYVYQEELN